MKRKITLLAAAVSLSMMSFTAYSQNHYCLQSPDGAAHVATFDISTGTLIDSIGVQFTSLTTGIDGFNGMAQDPISGDIYVTLKDNNSDKHLATINPLNGDVTSIGVLTINSSSITFDAAGTLYAMSGNGSTSLYTLNTGDATATLFYDYSTAGDDGEVIVVNTTDGLLYRYDGGADGDLISLNLGTLAETTIATLSGVDTWGGAFYYNSTSNDFTFAAGAFFYNLKTDGTFTTLSDIAALNWSGNFKGIHKIDYAGTTEMNQNTSNYTVYPNPSNGSLTIDTDSEFKLEVVDFKGSVIQEYTNVKNINIELAGVYFLRFIEQDNITVQKVIVQ